MEQFSSNRKPVYQVLAVQANIPLVSMGGGLLCDLSEQYFDTILDSVNQSRAYIFSTYDLALVGGEPYAIWR